MSRSDRRTRLDHLNQEIPQLKLRLKELEKERSEIFASLTFPVLTLPVEVTSEIFMHYTPPHTRPPLLLARICRRWREIALSMPQLWSTLTFYADVPQTQARDYLINHWLSLSRHHPLSICLYYGYPDAQVEQYPEEPDEDEIREAGRVASESIQSCLELVFKHSSRCRDVQLHLRPSVLQHPSISIPEGGFPILKHLRLGNNHDSQFAASNIGFFGTAPRLRSVELALDSAGDIMIEPFVLPWAQLTRFTGSMLCLRECHYVLERCTALLDCTFSQFTEEDAVVTSLAFTPITTLKSLAVGSTTHSLSALLASLTVPQLETLSARVGVDHLADISSVTQMVIQSGCALRHFKFTWSIPNGADETPFFDCLRHMPALSSLELSVLSEASCVAIFDRLRDDLELVPALQTFTILNKTVNATFPFPSLLAMLHSRFRRPRPLRHFKLQGTANEWPGFSRPKRPEPAIDLSGFDELVREGMVIQIRTKRRVLL